MKTEKIYLGDIPVIVWGEQAEKAYIYVHGKMASKESAGSFAEIAVRRGYQVISFDLPQHGERQDAGCPCTIWNGVHDLHVIGEYVFAHWEKVSLFGCSLGAFFSLYAYRDKKLESCLFLSPIVDMEYLIHQMFLWFGVSERLLEEKKEIQTPVDTLSWDYYQYVKENPIVKWEVPTRILYGGRDNMQSLEVMKRFADKFHCCLTVSAGSEHPFMGENDDAVLAGWMQDSLESLSV